jgi:hypothetical protein
LFRIQDLEFQISSLDKPQLQFEPILPCKSRLSADNYALVLKYSWSREDHEEDCPHFVVYAGDLPVLFAGGSIKHSA